MNFKNQTPFASARIGHYFAFVTARNAMRIRGSMAVQIAVLRILDDIVLGIHVLDVHVLDVQAEGALYRVDGLLNFVEGGVATVAAHRRLLVDGLLRIGDELTDSHFITVDVAGDEI